MFGINSNIIGSENIQKFIQQIEKKKEYNRSYYHQKVKPKREIEKQEIEFLREKCARLEEYISQLESTNHLHHEEPSKTNQSLLSQISDLDQEIVRLKNDNASLNFMLQAVRQQKYELMIDKADQILPNIKNLTIN